MPTSSGRQSRRRKPTKAKVAKPQSDRPKVNRAPDPAAELYDRQQSRRVLSCSLSTIIRLEEAGLLDKIKLNRTPLAKTHHRAAQVLALARGGDA